MDTRTEIELLQFKLEAGAHLEAKVRRYVKRSEGAERELAQRQLQLISQGVDEIQQRIHVLQLSEGKTKRKSYPPILIRRPVKFIAIEQV
jgi:hypothetical protein